MSPTWLQLLSAIGAVMLVDLALSGDNALVIGAATVGIPRRERWWALALGGSLAMLLRLVFTSLASYLLQTPYLQALSGLVVLAIAIRLFFAEQPASDQASGAAAPTALQKETRRLRRLLERYLAPQKASFLLAMLTILMADVTMSLDNVIAIGAIAQGQLLVLWIGLIASILLLLLGSALVAELLSHLPGLTPLAALILAWVGGNLLANDPGLTFFQDHEATIYIYVASFSVVIAAGIVARYQRYTHSPSRPHPHSRHSR
jgi:YjbE family integral membrane protein